MKYHEISWGVIKQGWKILTAIHHLQLDLPDLQDMYLVSRLWSSPGISRNQRISQDDQRFKRPNQVVFHQLFGEESDMILLIS